MEEKIKSLLAEKVKESEQLEKEGSFTTFSGYTERKDKLEIEIKLLNLILKL